MLFASWLSALAVCRVSQTGPSTIFVGENSPDGTASAIAVMCLYLSWPRSSLLKRDCYSGQLMRLTTAVSQRPLARRSRFGRAQKAERKAERGQDSLFQM